MWTKQDEAAGTMTGLAADERLTRAVAPGRWPGDSGEIISQDEVDDEDFFDDEGDDDLDDDLDEEDFDEELEEDGLDEDLDDEDLEVEDDEEEL